MDPLIAYATPPQKRRRLHEVIVTPPRYSDLLAAFGARQTPTSQSRMEKEAGHELRQKPAVSYAESQSSSTPNGSQYASEFGSPQSSRTSQPEHKNVIDLMDGDSEDELGSGEVIHGMLFMSHLD